MPEEIPAARLDGSEGNVHYLQVFSLLQQDLETLSEEKKPGERDFKSPGPGNRPVIKPIEGEFDPPEKAAQEHQDHSAGVRSQSVACDPSGKGQL